MVENNVVGYLALVIGILALLFSLLGSDGVADVVADVSSLWYNDSGVTVSDNHVHIINGNGKLVTSNGEGALLVADEGGNGGHIDFATNTASIGISSDGVSGGYDYDGTFVLKQKASNPDGEVEFLFIEESGSWRFALPSSGSDHATYNPRSLIVAGVSPDNGSAVHCSYWGFDNLDCDTSGTGADFGVQDDFEVLGTAFVGENVSINGGVVSYNGSHFIFNGTA